MVVDDHVHLVKWRVLYGRREIPLSLLTEGGQGAYGDQVEQIKLILNANFFKMKSFFSHEIIQKIWVCQKVVNMQVGL